MDVCTVQGGSQISGMVGVGSPEERGWGEGGREGERVFLCPSVNSVQPVAQRLQTHCHPGETGDVGLRPSKCFILPHGSNARDVFPNLGHVQRYQITSINTPSFRMSLSCFIRSIKFLCPQVSTFPRPYTYRCMCQVQGHHAHFQAHSQPKNNQHFFWGATPHLSLPPNHPRLVRSKEQESGPRPARFEIPYVGLEPKPGIPVSGLHCKTSVEEISGPPYSIRLTHY